MAVLDNISIKIKILAAVLLMAAVAAGGALYASTAMTTHMKTLPPRRAAAMPVPSYPLAGPGLA